MKKIAGKFIMTLSIVLLSASLYNVNAQDRGQHKSMEQNKERIEAQKVAFITAKLDLSSAEAEKFWPVFNNYKDQQKLKQTAWRDNHDFTPEDIDKMTDSDAEKLANARLNHEQEMLDMRKGLITDMKGVISPQKILLLFEAEKEFRMELMRKVSHGRGSQGRHEDRK